METKKMKRDTIRGIIGTVSGSRTVGPKLETRIGGDRTIGPKLETSIKVRDLPKSSYKSITPWGQGVEKKSEQLRKMLKKKYKVRGEGIKTTLV